MLSRYISLHVIPEWSIRLPFKGIVMPQEVPTWTVNVTPPPPPRWTDTGFPLFSSDKIPWLDQIPWLFQYFFHFSDFYLIFLWLLFNIYFFMYGLHLLLGNCIKSQHALKYEEYLLNWVQTYSWNSNKSTLKHTLGLPLTWSGLYTTQKREFWNSFSGKNSVIF